MSKESAPKSALDLPLSEALSFVLDEAKDIAEGTQSRLNTAHCLLAFFTSRNQTQRLLQDRNIQEDLLIKLFDAHQNERHDCVRELVEKSAQVAAGCGARSIQCLHLLVAMTRIRDSLAYRLLEQTPENVSRLRTRALAILTGAVPRWQVDDHRSPASAATVHIASSLPRRRRELPAEHPMSSRGVGRSPALQWRPPIIAEKMQQRVSAEQTNARDTHTDPRNKPESTRNIRAEQQNTAEPPSTRKANEPAPIQSLPHLPQKAASIEQAKRTSANESPAVSPTPIPPPANMARSPYALDPQEYPWLASIGRNLSLEAAQGELEAVCGRDKEIETLIDILGKRRANNPCLIGEPGVGKTAVVESLAVRLAASGRAKIILSLDVGGLLVGTHLRGSLSEKLQGIREEVKNSKGRIIIFFDELHTLVGAGATGDGPQDAANELKAALASGDFPCIGATTHQEYTRYVEADPALKRRFVPVLIREPSGTEAELMIKSCIHSYAEHHGVHYEEESIVAAVRLSERYLTERFLPDKALSLLDLAGSRAVRNCLHKVDAQLVAELVAERTDLPVESLLATDHDRLLHLEQHLEREIVGQRAALHRVAELIRRNAAGFRSQRPQGVFLFLGPTGVGKTETAKALARHLHGSESSMIRFDLSEFAEAHAIARLVGAPPGYVGHDSGGQLTELIRKKPGRVVLFDELEKAHPNILPILLQIVDEGRLTDSHGKTVSFRESIIILTSNLGSNLMQFKKPLGFADDAATLGATVSANFNTTVLEEARKHLAPELWGRFDEHLVFAPLTKTEIVEIARLLVRDSSERLNKERGITYEMDNDALHYLIEQSGMDLRLGARPIRQALARIIEAPIAARILEGRLHAGEKIIVSTRRNGSLCFYVSGESLSQRPQQRHRA